VLLLQRCQRIEVVERRSAWDVLEVAVLEDTERHRAGTLTRADTERTGEVILQAGKLVSQTAICSVYYSLQNASNGSRREGADMRRIQGHSRGGGVAAPNSNGCTIKHCLQLSYSVSTCTSKAKIL